MEPQDRDLLLKDLCARLPYIPIIKIEEHDWNNLHIDAYDTPFKSYYLEPFIIGEIEIKPYLRSMSSMTEEECLALSRLRPSINDAWKYIKTPVPLGIANLAQFDFFHSRHLDWRGLIPKGLALEAEEGMYKF